MKPLREDLQSLLLRASASRSSRELREQLPVVVREFAEAILGVPATVDLPPSKLATMLAELLRLLEGRTEAARRQRSLFDASDDGRRYIFPVEGQSRIVLCGECLLLCPVCGSLAPLELRHMNSDEVRNQPRCARCRKVKS